MLTANFIENSATIAFYAVFDVSDEVERNGRLFDDPKRFGQDLLPDNELQVVGIRRDDDRHLIPCAEYSGSGAANYTAPRCARRRLLARHSSRKIAPQTLAHFFSRRTTVGAVSLREDS